MQTLGIQMVTSMYNSFSYSACKTSEILFLKKDNIFTVESNIELLAC